MSFGLIVLIRDNLEDECTKVRKEITFSLHKRKVIDAL